jgi:basic membrane protein A and related proteins
MNNMRRYFYLAVLIVGLPFCLSCGRPARYGDRIKVAAVFPESRESLPAAVIHRALDEATQEMLIIYEVSDRVPPGEMERVLRDYVGKGYELIFGDDRGAEEIVRRVARDHPETAFCFNSRLSSVDPNFSVFNSWLHEPAYLCGRIAGRLTESGRVGVVAEDPHPALNAALNAFREGARDANPEVVVEILLAGGGAGLEREEEASARLIAKGADYIFAGSPAVIAVCREKRVPAFGYLKNWYSDAPDTMVTGAVWDLGPLVEKAVEEVKNESYRARDLREWSMMAKGGAYLAPYHSFETRLPDELKEEIDEIRRAILSGLYRVPANESLRVAEPALPENPY